MHFVTLTQIKDDFVATDANRTVGTLRVTRNERLNRQGFLFDFVEDVVVEPDCVGQGYAESMMYEYERIQRRGKRNCETLYVIPRNVLKPDGSLHGYWLKYAERQNWPNELFESVLDSHAFETTGWDVLYDAFNEAHLFRYIDEAIPLTRLPRSWKPSKCQTCGNKIWLKDEQQTVKDEDGNKVYVMEKDDKHVWILSHKREENFNVYQEDENEDDDVKPCCNPPEWYFTEMFYELFADLEDLNSKIKRLEDNEQRCNRGIKRPRLR